MAVGFSDSYPLEFLRAAQAPSSFFHSINGVEDDNERALKAFDPGRCTPKTKKSGVMPLIDEWAIL